MLLALFKMEGIAIARCFEPAVPTRRKARCFGNSNRLRSFCVS